MQTQTAIKAALLGLLVAGTLGAAGTAAAADKAMGSHDTQKCYGINAANKNDCQSPGHSCAGQDSKARDPQAFVAVPAGLCAKLAGGSLTASGGMMKDGGMMKKS